MITYSPRDIYFKRHVITFLYILTGKVDGVTFFAKLCNLMYLNVIFGSFVIIE
jgi:hypothetical protein